MLVRVDEPPGSAMSWSGNQACSLHASCPFNRYHPGFTHVNFTRLLLETSSITIPQFGLNFNIILAGSAYRARKAEKNALVDNALVTKASPMAEEDRSGTPESQISPRPPKLGPLADDSSLESTPGPALSLSNGAPICPIHTPICRKSHKIDVLDKSSFGPSQEDEGQKKTVHWVESSCLNPRHVWPIGPVTGVAIPVESPRTHYPEK